MMNTLILGAGLSGLSASYHIGHEKCLILERAVQPFGHLRSDFLHGFTWDQGPHLSFTKHEYVRQLFAAGVNDDYDEYEVKVANHFRGHWIDHPAQTSLYQIPEPLRQKCLDSFLATRSNSHTHAPEDYGEWLDRAFGPVFANTFPAAYTRKYWTREPRDLGVDWVGGRVFLPNVEDVEQGSRGPIGRSTHYITKVRYPRSGGYQAFLRGIAAGANIRLGTEVVRIDLCEKRVITANGLSFEYGRLVNTLPLPVFLALCDGVPKSVREAACALSCSQLLLVNVSAPHPTRRPENWLYVYDEDKFSTRINCTEKLTPGNAPAGHTGVQVEVYFSRHRPLSAAPNEVANAVKHELVEMGLVEGSCQRSGRVSHHLAYAPWANVIFDHGTRPALAAIWSWLEANGLEREPDDLHPLTDWAAKNRQPFGSLVMAGRFGQWKYYWTDDCVLRGQLLGNSRK